MPRNIKIITRKRKLSRLFIGLFCAIFPFLFIISLLSFNRADDSAWHYTSEHHVHNIAKELGAFMAEPVLQVMGYGALIPLILLFISSIKIAFNMKKKLFWLRLSLAVLLMLPISLLLSMIDSSLVLSIGYGGYIGSYLYDEIAGIIGDKYTIITSASVVVLALLFAVNIRLKEAWYLLKLFSKALAFVLVYLYAIVQFIIVQSRKMMIKFKTEEEIEMPEKGIPEEQPIEKKGALKIIKEKIKEGAKLVKIESNEGAFFCDSKNFLLPSTKLLQEAPKNNNFNVISTAMLEQNAKLLKNVLRDFGIKGEIVSIKPGPVVTLYEIEPAAGTKSARVIGLADDIARSMSAQAARVAVIAGKNAIGIELPNAKRQVVYMRELLENEIYTKGEEKLPLILGKNISGEVVVADLAKMPHLLVAGTTGSGKSVAINTMIISLLYRYTPKECRFIMIDPKMLELSVYGGIPHLLTPVVTEAKKAVVALKWVVKEMERRYSLMSTLGVRNINGYNAAISDALSKGIVLTKKVQTGYNTETKTAIYEVIELSKEALPYIVVIVDEMADLMLVAGKDIECYIQRIAQMARAAGIHLVMATQRPSVDVITGVIKANFPTRISFQVTSKIDSRTILGEQGAEQLLGMGDMLYMAGGGKISRVHGPFVDDSEVEAIVNNLREQGVPAYVDEVTQNDEEDEEALGMDGEQDDDLYRQAVEVVVQSGRASTSYVQRCLKIGYNRAANIIEQMERDGIVSAANHQGKREILKSG